MTEIVGDVLKMVKIGETDNLVFFSLSPERFSGLCECQVFTCNLKKHVKL